MIKAHGMAGFRLNLCECTFFEASRAGGPLRCLRKKGKGAGSATDTNTHIQKHTALLDER